MQILVLKVDKAWRVKSLKKWLFTYFMADFLARTEWKIKWYCKIKDKNLSFWVDELVSLLVYEFLSWWVNVLVRCWVDECVGWVYEVQDKGAIKIEIISLVAVAERG